MQISLTKTGGNSQSTRRSHFIITEKQATVNEFERRQSVGEAVSQKDLAEWGFKKLQLTIMSSQPTMSRLVKKQSHSYDECFFNLNRKRKSEGMHPDLKRPSEREGMKCMPKE